MDRAEDIPTHAKPIPGLARRRLLQRQRADQDRHGDLLPGRRRQSDAHPQEPAAARSAIFCATTELTRIPIDRTPAGTPVGWAKRSVPTPTIPAGRWARFALPTLRSCGGRDKAE